MIVYDRAGVKTAISPDGSGSVYDAQGRRISASSVASSLYSFDNPPSSPSAYDDEFNTTSLDAAWTVTSTGTTNPAVAGTVGPVSSLTTPVYDLATWPSWLLFQSDNSSAQAVDFDKAITLDANATLFVKIVCPNITTNAVNEGTTILRLSNSGDSNESVGIGLINTAGTGLTPRLFVENNGALTNSDLTAMGEAALIGSATIALWKSGNTYYGGIAGGTGTFTTGISVTKTGVTTLDRVGFRFRTANETPSLIAGVDFFRYYGSITYALRNPSV